MLTTAVADRGCASEVSGAIYGSLAWSKQSSEPNPPRQLSPTLGTKSK
jgi:hypothetical protein